MKIHPTPKQFLIFLNLKRYENKDGRIIVEVKFERQKTGTVIKVLTPKKLLTTLPVLLVQIKAGNNLCKLKNEISQVLCLLYQKRRIIKTLCNILTTWS